ncbi:MAG TPA: hypothetical protein VGP07_18810 [Polyangia bacterium]
MALVAGAGACGSSSSSGPRTGTGGAAGTAMGGAGAGGGGSSTGGMGGGGTAAGGSGAAGAGGGGVLDPRCAVPVPTMAPPYPTEIRFKNDSGAPLYVHQGCVSIDFAISSCASGFGDSVGPTYHCACPCDLASCTSNPACGACPNPTGIEIDASQFVSASWDAVAVAEEDRGSYTCVDSRALPAGRYRVAIRVYADAASAANDQGGRLVTQDFQLPTETGVLEVPVGTVQPDPCADAPTAALPTCTGAEPHDQACALSLSMMYAREGGLSTSTDAEAIAPPAAYTRTRTFTDPATPTAQCMAALPICSRDARVVTTGELSRVLTQATVVAAFGANTPVVGYDSRANDGSILVLRRPDGKSLGIGQSAQGNVVPPDFAAVTAVMSRLENQMADDPACVNLVR